MNAERFEQHLNCAEICQSDPTLGLRLIESLNLDRRLLFDIRNVNTAKKEASSKKNLFQKKIYLCDLLKGKYNKYFFYFTAGTVSMDITDIATKGILRINYQIEGYLNVFEI